MRHLDGGLLASLVTADQEARVHERRQHAVEALGLGRVAGT